VFKNDLAILALLGALAAFAIVPAAAQAAPHYYENRALLPEEAGPPEPRAFPWAEENAGRYPLLVYGPITLESPVSGPVVCINEFYTFIWNPIGGGAGRSETISWAASECHDKVLEEALGVHYIDITPEFPPNASTTAGENPVGQRRGGSLPWKGELCGPVFNGSTEEERYVTRTGLETYGEAGSALEPMESEGKFGCRKEATSTRTACYPHATGAATEHKWQDIVEPEGANTAAGEIAHSKGCVMLNFVIPEAVLEESEYFGTNETTVIPSVGRNALTPGGLKFSKGTEGRLTSGALESQEELQGHGTTARELKTVSLGRNMIRHQQYEGLAPSGPALLEVGE
jgi:hypothetical protein